MNSLFDHLEKPSAMLEGTETVALRSWFCLPRGIAQYLDIPWGKPYSSSCGNSLVTL